VRRLVTSATSGIVLARIDTSACRRRANITQITPLGSDRSGRWENGVDHDVSALALFRSGKALRTASRCLGAFPATMARSRDGISAVRGIAMAGRASAKQIPQE
jgi:hypothetical protein